ncbi:MAG: OsmC family protein [Anaerolineales bacterium]|jgi:putative redox protein
MDAKVIWQQGLHFSGTAASGFEVPLGSEVEAGGAEDGFRPLELMAVSLAGCTAMDVISILRKKQQAVTAFEVKVQADQAQEFPKVFTHVFITYLVTGHNVDEQALHRSIELSATKYCPAQAMLGKVVPMELRYEIYEGESAKKHALVKTGIYTPAIMET